MKLYPDLTEEETAEMQQLGAEMIESVEKTVVAERHAEKEAAESGAAASSTASSEGELSEEEAQKGVQIGRVLMRIGGGQRVVPFKIMPDDPTKFVLVKKDPDSGELLPVRWRGAKRYVVKNREGVWEPT